MLCYMSTDCVNKLFKNLLDIFYNVDFFSDDDIFFVMILMILGCFIVEIEVLLEGGWLANRFVVVISSL